MKIKILISFFLFLLFSCEKEKPKLAFYFWKQHFKLSKIEKNSLKSMKVDNIYLRYFDVKWDNIQQKAYPVAKAEIKEIAYNVTPVVYITNQVFKNTPKPKLPILAENMANLIQNMNKKSKGHLSNIIQIDCDWTETTKLNYFEFLKILNQKLNYPNLTCTIRLHQIKYFKKTGIPPVKTGILMDYNMGKLGNFTKNSIYNSEDAALYLPYLKNYPLPLDLALPIFSWIIHKQNGKIKNLIAKPNLNNFKNSEFLQAISENSFAVTKGFYSEGNYFKQGDSLYIERISENLLTEIAEKANKSFKNKPKNIIFYDLDERNLKNISHEQLSKIPSIFH